MSSKKSGLQKLIDKGKAKIVVKVPKRPKGMTYVINKAGEVISVPMAELRKLGRKKKK